MTDNREEAPLRPIPDGGLKDNMPNWLKRPPAWRSLSNIDQEQATPVVTRDQSPIDPRTLVDVVDLPMWLQRIAERPVEETSAAVEHAVNLIEAAQAPALLEPNPDVDELLEVDSETDAEEITPAVTEPGDAVGMTASPTVSHSGRRLSPALIMAMLVIIALIAYILVTF